MFVLILVSFVDIQVLKRQKCDKKKEKIMETVFNAWHPSWRDLPWKAWTSPIERFEVLPSFVIGEFFFIIAAILLLIHAAQHVGRNNFELFFVKSFSRIFLS